MPTDDQSLGDRDTFRGDAKDRGTMGPNEEKATIDDTRDNDLQSQGDRKTLDGGSHIETLFDDGMEVVDLSKRYMIERILGKGGMGQVVLALDTRLERKVAIKRILGDGVRSPTAVSRFLTEARAIAALNHPNIVHIHDYGRAADGPFLIMEFVEGRSLLDRCRQGAMPIEEAVGLTCQLCEALSMTHAANIIHRDIKPANILLTTSGIPKLTDFGLAKDEAADSGLSAAGAVLGTLDFMPPEQRRDAALVDNRSDLWSLAATLYQMVTGRSPRIIRFNNVPQALQDVLGKALEDAKDDRYQTAAEFRDALQVCLQNCEALPSDIGEGQCSICGTKNTTSRKFCRECSGPLQASCLSCEVPMPIWENICGECGANQKELGEPRRSEMAALQTEARSLLKLHEYDRATAIATKLHDEPHPRFHHLKDWSDQFLSEITVQQENQFDRMSELIAEALRHESAFDFKSGIRALEQIPEILRTKSPVRDSASADEILSRLTEKQNESKRLHSVIQQRLDSRQVTGLLSEVNALLTLHPGRESVLKLKQKLISRDAQLKEKRDAAYQEAQRLLEIQEYDSCLSRLKKIDDSVMREEIVNLRTEAETLRDRLNSLRSEISSDMKLKKRRGLLKKVHEGLSLKNGDPELEKLRERLQEMEDANASKVAEIVKSSQSLRMACRFEEATTALKRIPDELMTDMASDLHVKCSLLATERARAFSILRESIDSQKFAAGLSGVLGYQELLTTARLEDSEFLDLYRSCQTSLEEQREAIESAKREAAIRRKQVLGTVVEVTVHGPSRSFGAGCWWRLASTAAQSHR